MPSHQIDHGDVVEKRYVYLTPANHRDVIVLVRDDYEEVAEQVQANFFKRHPGGELCNGHIHDSLDEARSCANRTTLDPPWSDLARVVVETSIRNRRRQDGAEDFRHPIGTTTRKKVEGTLVIVTRT